MDAGGAGGGAGGALAGRRALVTGAGSGIGRAIATGLAREGARLALAGRTREALERLAAELASAGGPEAALPLVCDVTSRESVAAASGQLAERWGGADILVNAAGDAASAPIGRTDEELWERMLAVNLTGTFRVTRALLPGMIERGWGRIVNIASTAGRAGFPYTSAYTAAKHGVVGLTRALAAELAGRGVTVNAVCPGYVDTDLTRRTIENITRKTGRSPAEAREALERQNPQGRLIEPVEVARLAVTLCLPESGGISGQAIVIDGGGLQR